MRISAPGIRRNFRCPMAKPPTFLVLSGEVGLNGEREAGEGDWQFSLATAIASQ